MTKEGKTILAIIVGTILLVGGFAFLMTRASSGSNSNGKDSYINNVEAANLGASPSGRIDLGKVPYRGGIISKSFDIKNTSTSAIKLRKITTSCMCTVAKVKLGNKETKFYGMEMNGDLNPLLDFDLPAGETAQVIFEFDPAAHGPQGIGAVDRVIMIFFDVGYKILEFDGEVVK